MVMNYMKTKKKDGYVLRMCARQSSIHPTVIDENIEEIRLPIYNYLDYDEAIYAGYYYYVAEETDDTPWREIEKTVIFEYEPTFSSYAEFMEVFYDEFTYDEVEKQKEFDNIDPDGDPIYIPIVGAEELYKYLKHKHMYSYDDNYNSSDFSFEDQLLLTNYNELSDDESIDSILDIDVDFDEWNEELEDRELEDSPTSNKSYRIG